MQKSTDPHVLSVGALRAAHPLLSLFPNDSSVARDHDLTREDRGPPGLEALNCQNLRFTTFDLEFPPLESYLPGQIWTQTLMYMAMYCYVVYGIKTS